MPRILPTAAALVAAVGLTIGLATPAQAATPPKYSVSIAVTSSKTPAVGDWVSLSGATSKKLSGTAVAVQRRHGSGAWARAQSAKVSKTGAISAKVRSSAAGAYSYRFFISASRTHQSSSSSAAGTTAYGYFYLSDLDMVAPSPPRYWVDTTSIAGKTYFHSLKFHITKDQPGFAEYNLGYKCKSFDTTVGSDDATLTGTIAHEEVLADGSTLGAYDFAPGKGTAVQYDISGVFRLKLTTATAATTGGWTYPAFGNARVLCSSKP